MTVIIVSIIVGLVAGAAGGVVGPAVVRLLARREHKGRGIPAELRMMVEQRLGDCDEAIATVFGILVHLDAGHSPLEAYDRTMARRWERSQDRPLLRWEPERIDDGPLRALSLELDHNLREFDAYLESVATVDSKAWRAEVRDRVWQLERLKRQVRERLDELRY